MRSCLRRSGLLLACLLALATSSLAQYVTVNGSHVVNSAGTPLASGTLNICPVTNKGLPLAFHLGGSGGTAIASCVQVQVTAGAFTTQLPDTYLTNPQNVCMSFSVQDPVTFVEDLPGYSCVQPSNQAASASVAAGWCSSGGSCNLDNFIPYNAALPVVTVGGNTSEFAGTYSGSVAYSQGQIVLAGGAVYLSLIAGNTGNTPSSSPSDWIALSGSGSGSGGSSGSLALTDTATGSIWSLASTNGALQFAASSGSGSTSVLLTDTVTGSIWSLASTNGAPVLTASSGSGVSSYTFTDTVTGTHTLSVANGALQFN